MKNENYTTIILTAEEGHYLTQASDDIDIMNRVIATRVALGKNSSQEDWKEITKEEGDELLEAKNKAYEENKPWEQES